jgi:hypothetical protein
MRTARPTTSAPSAAPLTQHPRLIRERLDRGQLGTSIGGRCRRAIWLCLVCAPLAHLLVPQGAGAAGTSRFVITLGANNGGSTRQQLRYAVADAERFAAVMAHMGGVEAADALVLREPGSTSLLEALDELAARIRRARQDSRRTEVFLYYSGHADERGLLLGDEQLSYAELRAMLDRVDADVRIAILDACASGSITRLKGGQQRAAFLLDASRQASGFAFLTSSSADEAAQESDAIGASFFTHYLVSGMRGAADVSGDRRVTLTEAYQFAFNETLARTVQTQGGAQHPAYHINLSGTGDVVMTDVRRTSARLVLDEAMSGRFFVRNEQQQLVAELYKPPGRLVELGLEPGRYSVHLDRTAELLVASADLASGQRLVLHRAYFRPTEREDASARGGATGRHATPVGILTGRSRLELRLGSVSPGPREAQAGAAVRTTAGTWGLLLGLTYARMLPHNLAITVGATVLSTKVDIQIGSGVTAETLTLTSLLAGVRRYGHPYPALGGLRPYLTATAGVFVGSVDQQSVHTGVAVRAGSMGSAGGQLGVGADLQFSRRTMLGLQASYNLMLDFEEELGGRRNYTGPELHVGVSYLFGRSS